MSQQAEKRVLVVAGPTASGKSGLAMRLGEAEDGTIINADSMQVYADLRILTARPPAADERRLPHRLYGVLAADQPCSAAAWCDMALAEIELALSKGRQPIVVGGTGLYLTALIEGLNNIPDIPPHIRQATRDLLAALGNAAFHDQLSRWDPKMAARLSPGDSQRMVRAWEVMMATNRSLADWQAEERVGPPPGMRFDIAVLMPRRAALNAACDDRFDRMMTQGALAEVAVLRDRALPRDLPAMKALGVPELLAHLDGELDLKAAVERAKTATRRYAKRQMTWLRGQLIDRLSAKDAPDRRAVLHVSHDHDAQHSERFCAEFLANIRNTR
ncbi:MAG: tRNA (adenosine(37)-N6)-dimethylallyltransferase MiaA [Azospirillaceae bacterium]